MAQNANLNREEREVLKGFLSDLSVLRGKNVTPGEFFDRLLAQFIREKSVARPGHRRNNPRSS